jgi:hypothetical protein
MPTRKTQAGATKKAPAKAPAKKKAPKTVPKSVPKTAEPKAEPKARMKSDLLDDLAAMEGRVLAELADPEARSVHVRDALLQFRSAFSVLRDARKTEKSLEQP